MKKKLYAIITLCFCLMLISSCGDRYDANEFWINAENENYEYVRLEFFTYDGTTTQSSEITDAESITKIMEILKSTKSERLDDFSRDDITHPVICLRFTEKHGKYMTAVFTNGIMISHDKTPYGFTLDPSVNEYFTDGMQECELRDIPGLGLLAEDENGWVAEYMPEATFAHEYEYPEQITMVINGMKDGKLEVLFSNNGYEEWDFGSDYTLHALAKEKWRDIPEIKTMWDYYVGVGHQAAPRLTQRHYYSLPDDLPSGTYRLTAYGASAEFELFYDENGETAVESAPAPDNMRPEFYYLDYNNIIPNKTATVKICKAIFPEEIYFYLCKDHENAKNVYIYYTDDYGKTVNNIDIELPTDIEYSEITPLYIGKGAGSGEIMLGFTLHKGEKKTYITYDNFDYTSADDRYTFKYRGIADDETVAMMTLD